MPGDQAQKAAQEAWLNNLGVQAQAWFDEEVQWQDATEVMDALVQPTDEEQMWLDELLATKEQVDGFRPNEDPRPPVPSLRPCEGSLGWRPGISPEREGWGIYHPY